MAKLCKRRRPLRLEVGFEVRRGSQEALERAYERLLPLCTRPLPSRIQATTSEGACHENSAPENRFGSGEPEGGHLRPRCLIAPFGSTDLFFSAAFAAVLARIRGCLRGRCLMIARRMMSSG
jgi:hypothetical protein